MAAVLCLLCASTIVEFVIARSLCTIAYTLTQARPLLTTAELELFSQSRTELVKRLAPADLAGATTGEDNARTQRKADILQDVLERYEARAVPTNPRKRPKPYNHRRKGRCSEAGSRQLGWWREQW